MQTKGSTYMTRGLRKFIVARPCFRCRCYGEGEDASGVRFSNCRWMIGIEVKMAVKID